MVLFNYRYFDPPFFIFAAPKSIRGTLNVVTLVVLLVSFGDSALLSNFPNLPITFRIFLLVPSLLL